MNLLLNTAVVRPTQSFECSLMKSDGFIIDEMATRSDSLRQVGHLDLTRMLPILGKTKKIKVRQEKLEVKNQTLYLLFLNV